MNKAKTTIINTMITTGTSLVLLAVFILIVNDPIVFSNVVLEIFGANIVINCGLLLTRKFESRYIILEYLLDVSYIIAVLVAFGIFFDWFSAVPIWILVGMAIVIYIFMIITAAFRIQNTTKKINELLQKRREKTAE